ncbi:MAG: PAS domain-containing protein [Bacillota bacterium]|nr:PAS domain-containing protein [Bacillota bacterium]
MIFKEENILFPTALEKLQTGDWIDILKESDQIGYAYIKQPSETAHMIEALKKAAADNPFIEGDKIKLPSGLLSAEQLMYMLNTLPVDLTFVDHDDTVRYFSENRERIFVRTRAIVGRNVRNCHPPQSVDQVEKILKSFKEGTRDSAEFWLTVNGKMIYIVFYAVRDDNGKYLGTLEIAQDITALQALEGERKLLDEE